MTLTETTPNSGIFEGTLALTDNVSTCAAKIHLTSVDTIKVAYDASHPRAKFIIDGATQNGTAKITEVTLPKGDNPSALTDNAVNLTLGDGAQLQELPCQFIKNDPEQTDLPCSTLNVTMSYANIPLTFEKTREFCASCGEDPPPGTTIEIVTPADLTIYEKVGDSWIDLGNFENVDENTTTITATVLDGPGIFLIGVRGFSTFTPPPPPGCNASVSQGDVVTQETGGCGGGGGGGAGGGIPLPGAGVVLDFIAGVVDAQPPTTPPPEPQPPATSSIDAPLLDTPLSVSDQVTNLPPLASEISATSDNNTGPSDHL